MLFGIFVPMLHYYSIQSTLPHPQDHKFLVVVTEPNREKRQKTVSNQLVALVDKSGSMSGCDRNSPISRMEIAHEFMRKQENPTIYFFDGQFYGEKYTQVDEAFEKNVPSNGTDFTAALNGVTEHCVEMEKPMHLLFLTDGEDPGFYRHLANVVNKKSVIPNFNTVFNKVTFVGIIANQDCANDNADFATLKEMHADAEVHMINGVDLNLMQLDLTTATSVDLLVDGKPAVLEARQRQNGVFGTAFGPNVTHQDAVNTVPSDHRQAVIKALYDYACLHPEDLDACFEAVRPWVQGTDAVDCFVMLAVGQRETNAGARVASLSTARFLSEHFTPQSLNDQSESSISALSLMETVRNLSSSSTLSLSAMVLRNDTNDFEEESQAF